MPNNCQKDLHLTLSILKDVTENALLTALMSYFCTRKIQQGSGIFSTNHLLNHQKRQLCYSFPPLLACCLRPYCMTKLLPCLRFLVKQSPYYDTAMPKFGVASSSRLVLFGLLFERLECRLRHQ
jgi:hypothetical protein